MHRFAPLLVTLALQLGCAAPAAGPGNRTSPPPALVLAATWVDPRPLDADDRLSDLAEWLLAAIHERGWPVRELVEVLLYDRRRLPWGDYLGYAYWDEDRYVVHLAVRGASRITVAHEVTHGRHGDAQHKAAHIWRGLGR